MLTATGTASAAFQAWSGCPNPAGDQCIVIPASSATVSIGVQFGAFTPPTSTLSVARGSTSVRRTSFGWSVTLFFHASRSTVATPCLLYRGACSKRFNPLSLPARNAGISLALPRRTITGARTIRITFRAGGQLRTVLWSVNLT